MYDPDEAFTSAIANALKINREMAQLKRDLTAANVKLADMSEQVSNLRCTLASSQAELQSRLTAQKANDAMKHTAEIYAITNNRSMAARLLVADATAVTEELQRRIPSTENAPLDAPVPRAMDAAVAALGAWTEASSRVVTQHVLDNAGAAVAAKERLDAAMEVVRYAVDNDATKEILDAAVEERDSARAEYVAACQATVQRARSCIDVLESSERELKERLCVFSAASAMMGTRASPSAVLEEHTRDGIATRIPSALITPVEDVVKSARTALATWVDESSADATKATRTMQALVDDYFDVLSATVNAKDPNVLANKLPLVCQALSDALQAECDRMVMHETSFPADEIAAALLAMQHNTQTELDAITRVREVEVELDAAAKYHTVDRPDPAAALVAQKAVRAAKRQCEAAVHALEDAIEDEGAESEAAMACRSKLKAAKKNLSGCLRCFCLVHRASSSGVHFVGVDGMISCVCNMRELCVNISIIIDPTSTC